MSVSPSYKAYVLDQLSAAGAVTARSMFGGVGLYCEGLFFGLIADDPCISRWTIRPGPNLSDSGPGPFAPTATIRHAMQYYELPADVRRIVGGAAMGGTRPRRRPTQGHGEAAAIESVTNLATRLGGPDGRLQCPASSVLAAITPCEDRCGPRHPIMLERLCASEGRHAHLTRARADPSAFAVAAVN